MDVATPRRDRQAYARLRRLDWGDALLGDGDWRRAAVIIPTG